MARLTEDLISKSYEGLLPSDETVLSQSYGFLSNKCNPYWIMMFFGALGIILAQVKSVFIIATDKRLIFIEYKNYKPTKNYSLNWNEISKVSRRPLGGIYNLALGTNQTKYILTIQYSNLFVKTEKANVDKLKQILAEKFGQ